MWIGVADNFALHVVGTLSGPDDFLSAEQIAYMSGRIKWFKR